MTPGKTESRVIFALTLSLRLQYVVEPDTYEYVEI